VTLPGGLKNINLDEGVYAISNTQAVIFGYEKRCNVI